MRPQNQRGAQSEKRLPVTTVASAFWKRIDRPGHDFCQLKRDASGWSLNGVAVFLTDSQPTSISYSVRCNTRWEAVSGLIRGSIGLRAINYVVKRRDGVWTLNDACVPGLEDLVDLDFSFTPATNLTQLRRVSLPVDQAVQVPVAWFDLDAGTLTQLPQVYQRQAEKLVWYEAPTLGYSAALELDANDFITSYPSLWEAETGC